MTEKYVQSNNPANYNATPPTLVDGEMSSLQVDQKGNTKVTDQGQYNATPLSLADGETAPRQVDNTGAGIVNPKPLDPVNDGVRAYDDDYNYTVIKTATTTTIKTGAGFIKEIRVLGGTLGAVTVYDNTAGSGSEIVPAITPGAPLVLKKSCAFGTGLTIVTATATIVVVSWR